jgi:uncharacterized protein YbjT (DUF2867 family)
MTQASPLRVLVTGANGRTGRAVVRALARRAVPGALVCVRALLRDPAQWPAVAALGAAEFAVGDMTDPASLAVALRDCDTLVHIGPPMHPLERVMTGHFIAAAQAVGLRHFVYYSVLQPLRRDIRHHRLKLEAEEDLVESGLAYTILQPSRYMQHLEPIWKTVLSAGVHAMPFSTEVRFNVADLLDLAEATATVVAESAPSAAQPGLYHFGSFELAGPEALSQQDMAGIIGAVTGRAVTAAQVPIAEMEARARAAGFGEDRVGQMASMNRHYDAHGMPGNPRVLAMLLGREPTSFRAYVRRLSENTPG